MNKIQKLTLLCVIAGLAVFGFTKSSVAKSNVPPLTCGNFLDGLKGAENSKELENLWVKQVDDIWQTERTKFKENHPDIYDPRLDKIKITSAADGGPLIQLLMGACGDNGNSPYTLGQDLQKFLYMHKNFKKLAKEAYANGCELTMGSTYEGFPRYREVLVNLCSDPKSSVSVGGGKSADGSNVVKFCTESNGQNSCVSVLPTKEIMCFNEFGSCRKNEVGKCGWVHTKESQKCLEKGS